MRVCVLLRCSLSGGRTTCCQHCYCSVLIAKTPCACTVVLSRKHTQCNLRLGRRREVNPSLSHSTTGQLCRQRAESSEASQTSIYRENLLVSGGDCSPWRNFRTAPCARPMSSKSSSVSPRSRPRPTLNTAWLTFRLRLPSLISSRISLWSSDRLFAKPFNFLSLRNNDMPKRKRSFNAQTACLHPLVSARLEAELVSLIFLPSIMMVLLL